MYYGNCSRGSIGLGAQDHYWGPEFSSAEIQTTLEKYNIPYRKFSDIENQAASLLAEGKLIGWFQGRMEFGQRALGNRSILADPRDKMMKDKVNEAVKYREKFRPFAPSVVEEKAEQFFDIKTGQQIPFMERIVGVNPKYRHVLPAVTHYDGSARVQTVSHKVNPRFYKLIKEFERRTNLPIVLNTSFNLNGEAIVCSPTDAIRTFYSCGLDYLILGDYLIAKK